MLILWIILFSVLGSLGAIFTASIFLSFPEKIQNTLIPCLISYASGTLITAALLGLIPHAFNHSDPQTVLTTVLIGIILFFLLEKLIIWRHCHNHTCETHGVVGPMILIGDVFHNAADGFIIAAGFLVSIPFGIAVSISVIAHEVPQEVGDFAILLHSGYAKKKALTLNLLSSSSTIPIAILGYYILETITQIIPYVMALSAASFMYIALTDLYPELHHKFGFWYETRQFLLMIAGIGTIIILLQFHP